MIILSSFVETIVIYFYSFIINFCCQESSACQWAWNKKARNIFSGGFKVKVGGSNAFKNILTIHFVNYIVFNNIEDNIKRDASFL